MNMCLMRKYNMESIKISPINEERDGTTRNKKCVDRDNIYNDED